MVERAVHDDGFGFVVHWRFDEHWVDLKVFEVVLADESGGIEFQRDGSPFGPDGVGSVLEAEVYADGYIKWDGCSEIDWGHHHWCGVFWWERQMKLMMFLWTRAFELMGRDPDGMVTVPTSALSVPDDSATNDGSM